MLNTIKEKAPDRIFAIRAHYFRKNRIEKCTKNPNSQFRAKQVGNMKNV